ncbi:MAG: bifunctional 4-hydroxy-2-oxoglutarate aldolase/2-dehydro-3-deoxy-phosphogluconate aldolase [Christensenellaceae bacterium]|nr:bifunctional 4-hydroxy-2-oxoglutarate aldolase/2-dehydro-3-deoxy-phosphogluconate aldolase [Christensenellaceae bacterium]
MNKVLKTLGDVGIVPVIAVSEDKAVDLGRAMIAGGIPVMEITFRKEGAERAIAKVAKELPEILVGAGTVLTLEQAKLAIDAGAKFIVSPGYDPEIVAYCKEAGVVVAPGCSTPSEINEAMKAGLEVVKFFSAEASGGIGALKDFSGPFASMKFIPAGGMTMENIGEYAKQKNVLAVAGDFMVPTSLIEAGDFAAITELCKATVNAMFGFKLLHIGINAENKEESKEWAMLLQALFGFKANETAISYFASSDIEIMSGGGRGKNGHIGVGTNCIYRAMKYFEDRGYAMCMETARYDASGKINFIYIEKDICGFAFHLNQRA